MNYKNIFINKELSTLLGSNKRNLLICSALLFISVFTISLSLGAYDQLKERMDNPFTNWVTMPVLYEYRENIPALRDHFAKQENASSFGLKNISGYVKWTFKIIHPDTKKVKDITGRTLDFSDNITQKIFESGNTISLKDNFDADSPDNKFELFVNQEFCKELNIDPKDAVGKQLLVKDFEDNFVLLFTIGGVVKNLPNHSKFIMSQDFFNMFKEKYEITKFIEVKNGTELVFISKNTIDEKIITESLGDVPVIDIETESISIAGKENYQRSTIYTGITINDSIKNNFYNDFLLKGDTIFLEKKWNFVDGYSELSEPMYLSFNFENLGEIRGLQEFLKVNYKMEIELSVVEERDNFSMVSNLTYFMIISLILVSLISFSIFLFNLIKNHLDKIKPNIGTFMAFGFSGKVIADIYIKTVVRFMMYAWVIVLCLVFIFWNLGYFTGLYYLKLWHPIVILTFVLFNVMSYVLSKKITTDILNETPGDLIYGRV